MADDEQAADGHAYRAKLMNQAGQIETTVAILAHSDVEAVEQVQGLARTYSVQVWDHGRVVITLPFKGGR